MENRSTCQLVVVRHPGPGGGMAGTPRLAVRVIPLSPPTSFLPEIDHENDLLRHRPYRAKA